MLAFVYDEAVSAYPNECCGVLEGLDERDGEPRRIMAARRIQNATSGRRFRIDADVMREAERDADRRGRLLLGFYHSHPDAPGSPSRTDLEGAWPWYTYVIVSVSPARRNVVRAWRLADDRSAFLHQRIEETEP